MTCSGCKHEFGEKALDTIVASISGSISGDEYTDIYYRCPQCGCYTIVQVCEPFFGEEQRTASGPLDPAAANARVAIIRGCTRPWDKKCRCLAHRTYFGDVLD